MQLEVSTQHHPIVLGRASSNLREIMSRTGTQVSSVKLILASILADPLQMGGDSRED